MDLLSKSKELGLYIEQGRKLSDLTTWKIGGRARFFSIAKTSQQAVNLVKLAVEFGLPFFALGAGSNVLVSDNGFSGLVIKPEINYISVQDIIIKAGAGVSMGRLATFAMQKNLLGLEWAVGLPGTIGGAIFGNSNCFGGFTGDSLYSAVLVDGLGKVREVKNHYFNFEYDSSILQKTGEIVLEADFKLKKISETEMEKKRQDISKIAAYRIATQPLGEKTAGSVFKAIEPNPKIIEQLEAFSKEWKKSVRDGLISPGFVIDQCLKLKGYRLDKMKISEKHANFFVNLGGATAKNCKSLIDFVKVQCQNKMNIKLEEEIRYLGDFL